MGDRDFKLCPHATCLLSTLIFSFSETFENSAVSTLREQISQSLKPPARTEIARAFKRKVVRVRTEHPVGQPEDERHLLSEPLDCSVA